MTETATKSPFVTVTLTLEQVVEIYQAIQAIDAGFEDVVTTDKGTEKIRRRYRISDHGVYRLGINHGTLRKQVEATQASLNGMVDELSNGVGSILREILDDDGSKVINPAAVEFDRRRQELLSSEVTLQLRTIRVSDLVVDGDHNRSVPATIISVLMPILEDDSTL